MEIRETIAESGEFRRGETASQRWKASGADPDVAATAVLRAVDGEADPKINKSSSAQLVNELLRNPSRKGAHAIARRTRKVRARTAFVACVRACVRFGSRFLPLPLSLSLSADRPVEKRRGMQQHETT